jgi:glycosyltransferase involved in cell wall biosynthesis
MKILQVCPKYYPSIGGVEEHVRNLSERLARKHEITVFTCDPSGKLPEEEKINRVSVRRFKSFSPNAAYYISFDMLRELKNSSFDIIHGHSYHAFPLHFCRYAERKQLVVTPHYHRYGHTPFRNFLIKSYKPFGRKILVQADKIIAVSHYEKKLLLNDFTISENKISVIPNGYDLSEFHNMETLSRENKTILYVGRLEKYKGVQYTIQSLPLLDKSLRLEIVGKGPYKASLMTQIDRLGLNDRVTWYQDLPRQELLKLYARASVFVLLSQYEAFGQTVGEALALKTRCIVANTSALTGWIDNKNCFGIDYPLRADKVAGLITRVSGKNIGDVKLLDWDEVAQLVESEYTPS